MSNVKYHFARNSFGEIIDIKDVQKGEKTTFYCIECGDEMSAVLGDKREHHFRHKNSKCSYESYLHKLGKERLKKLFDESEKFEIHCNVSYKCNVDCELNCREKISHSVKIIPQIFDLKFFYDKCETEKEYKGYVADLLLSSSKFPNLAPLFLEIAYKHDCEQEKLDSGIKIIEFKINDDSDLDFTLPLKEEFNKPIKDRKIRFYNFNYNYMPDIMLFRVAGYKGSDGIIRHKIGEIECKYLNGHYSKFMFDITVRKEDKKQLGSLLPIILFNNGIKFMWCPYCQKFNYCTAIENNTRRIYIKNYENKDIWYQRPYQCPQYKYQFKYSQFPYKIWKNPDSI